MSEPQAPAETAGNALRALQGQSLEVNAPFEQVGRLAEAIKNGGGGGGGYDDSELRRRIEALEKPTVFIAQYQQTNAQDIVAFLNNNPHAALLVQNGDDIYTTIFSKKLAENKVLLRTIASLQSKFNIFEYTVTDGSWRATTTPLYYDDTTIQAQIAKNAQNIDRIARFVGFDLEATVDYWSLKPNQGVVMPDGVGVSRSQCSSPGATGISGLQVCLIGARTGTSATERTCINVLPQSGQVQSQWANNAYKVLKDDMNFFQPFNFTADKSSTLIRQNGQSISSISNGEFVGTNPDTPICLFNQSLNNSQYFSPVLQSAAIQINGVTTIFEPKIKQNLETGEESVVLLKDGVEMQIDGLSLFEIQAA